MKQDTVAVLAVLILLASGCSVSEKSAPSGPPIMTVPATEAPPNGVRERLRHASTQVGDLDREQLAELDGLLTGDDPEESWFAALVLGPRDGAADLVVPVLASIVTESEDSSLRLLATQAIGRYHGHPRLAVLPLTRALDDPDVAVRDAAAGALGTFDPSDDAAMAHGALERAATQDSSVRIRQRAVLALAQSGVSALPALRAALDDESDSVRRAAVEALASVGRGGLPLLMQTYDSGGALGAEVVSVLATSSRGTGPGVPFFTRALRDGHVVDACRALCHFGVAAMPSVPALLEALRETEGESWYYAAWTLGRIGDRVVSGLVEVLQDPRAHVRGRAAYALGEIGPAARDAMAPLWQLLTERDHHTRRVAREALARIRS